jgi:hypothetical protein
MSGMINADGTVTPMTVTSNNQVAAPDFGTTPATMKDIQNLQNQINELHAKLCVAGTALATFCNINPAPPVVIPSNPFLHLDGAKYSGSGPWIDQTGRGLDASVFSTDVNTVAPTYDATNKCFIFDYSKNTAFRIDTQKKVPSIPGVSEADYAKMNAGTQQLGYQLNAGNKRTFAMWVKYTPFTGAGIPGNGKIRSQYALGFGRNESGYTYSIGSTYDGRPMIYNGNYDGWTSLTDPQVGTNNYQKQELATSYSNTWILMIATYDGTNNTNTIYIDDGTTKQSWNPRSAINTIPEVFWIGRIAIDSKGGAPNFTATETKFFESLTGSVGMVTVYNRAFTPAEVKQYFDATKGNYKK